MRTLYSQKIGQFGERFQTWINNNKPLSGIVSLFVFSLFMCVCGVAVPPSPFLSGSAAVSYNTISCKTVVVSSKTDDEKHIKIPKQPVWGLEKSSYYGQGVLIKIK